MIAEQQFELIYQENYQHVMGLCLGYVNGDKDMASDLAQEVFIKVWENLKTFRNEASLSTWIYRIAINTCLQQLRKKKMLPLKTEVQADDNEEDFSRKEKHYDNMYACINLLSANSKSIILLELQDVPQREIAKIMGMSYEALRVKLHRIKNQLAKCVKDERF